MIIAPYVSGKDYDEFFPMMIAIAKEGIEKNNDDALFMSVGRTGTGKSNLLLHGYTVYSPTPNPEQIGLNREKFAQVHHQATVDYEQGKPHRFVGYDEANVSKREAMSKWNRDLLTLYFANRELGILHWWCNPSLEIIDKPFVEERLTGIFYIYTKDKVRPRKYIYFTKKGILDMLEEGIELNHRNLLKYAMKYGYYQGWFKKYQGDLLKPYLVDKKESAMKADTDFYEKYGLRKYGRTDAALMLGISPSTLTRLLCYAFDHDIIQRDEVIRGNGTYVFTDKIIEKIRFLEETKPDLSKYRNKATFQSKNDSIEPTGGRFKLPNAPLLFNRAKEENTHDLTEED